MLPLRLLFIILCASAPLRETLSESAGPALDTYGGYPGIKGEAISPKDN